MMLGCLVDSHADVRRAFQGFEAPSNLTCASGVRAVPHLEARASVAFASPQALQAPPSLLP